MKKIMLILAMVALAFSPMFVSQAQAGQGKRHKVHKAQHQAKHQAKKLAKHQAKKLAKHLAKRQAKHQGKHHKA